VESRVEQLLNVEPESVPIVLELLSNESRFTERELKTRLAENLTDHQRFRANIALATLGVGGDTHLQEIVKQTTVISAPEFRNLILALQKAPKPAIPMLLQELSQTSDPIFRARLAIALFHLGSPDAIRDCLAIKPDAVERFAVIHLIGELDGPLIDYILYLQSMQDDTKSHNDLSGLVKALKYSPLGSAAEPDRQQLQTILSFYANNSPSGAMHSAATFVLRDFIGPSETTRQEQPAINNSAFDWLRAECGLTFVRIDTTKLSQSHLDKNPLVKVLLGDELATVRPFYLSTQELPVALFKEFADDPANRSFFATPWNPNNTNPAVPATKISPLQGIEFCNWLSDKEKRQPCYRRIEPPVKPDSTSSDAPNPKIPIRWQVDEQANGYRLPSKAEMYLARFGDSERSIPVGLHQRFRIFEQFERYSENSLSKKGNCLGICGQLSPNDLGLHDMGGNASEIFTSILEPPDTDKFGYFMGNYESTLDSMNEPRLQDFNGHDWALDGIGIRIVVAKRE
jgi:hypothetical protein